MKKLSLQVLWLFLLLGFNSLNPYGFYIKSSKDLKTSNLKLNFASTNNLRTVKISETPTDFPDEFTVSLPQLKRAVTFERIKNDSHYPISSANIYTIDSAKQVKKYEETNTEKNFEIYRERYSGSFATLIRNKENVKSGHSQPFRMLGTVHTNGSAIVQDILPVSNSDDSFNSDLNDHTVVERVDKVGKIDSFDSKLFKMKIKKAQEESAKRTKRSNNGVPFDLHCETMVVTDKTIFDDHVRFAGTNNTDLVFLHMKAYFAHYMNGVNQRYQNSFTTDPDLKISIHLTDYLFLTNDSESNWTNPVYHGVADKPTYEDKTVVVASKVLDAFKDYMNAKAFTNSYDHAIGFFNKDMWTSDAGSDSARAGVVGLAYLAGVCQNERYSITEENGAFSSIGVTAHEIGHNLGSGHDGENDALYSSCPVTLNNIMTPSIGVHSDNLLNQLKFSSCSLNAFKSVLLTNSNSEVSNTGKCLVNVPSALLVNPYAVFTNQSLPGQSYTADDQCRAIYGPGASFCQYLNSTMCTTLSCRKSSTATQCTFTKGMGVVEGTTCGAGKMCLKGECTSSDLVKNDATCPFGDEIIVNKQVLALELPKVQMTCQEVFDHISTTLNELPVRYCSDPLFKSACCDFCKRYESITCLDKSTQCATDLFKQHCGTGATVGDLSVDDFCPRTCKKCDSSPLRCNSTTYLCQNGGRCSNTTVDSIGLVGFKCQCTPAYTGSLCEIEDKCKTSPCKAGSTCQNFGSKGYVCLCQKGCSGYNCDICEEVVTFPTTVEWQFPTEITDLNENTVGSETTISAATTSPVMVTTTEAPTTTTTLAPTTTQDIFANVDQDIVFILSNIYTNSTQQEIAAYAFNESVYLPIFDEQKDSFWKDNCEIARKYYKFLENELVERNKTLIVDYDRINPLLICKLDCQFDRILSVASNFSTDKTNFAKNVLNYLNSDISCRTSSIGDLIVPPATADDLVSNLNQIGLLSMSALNNFSASDSVKIAKALSSGNQKMSKEMAKSLGANIPVSASVTEVLSIASSIPLECFNNTKPSDLVSSLEKMDTDNMDSFRKSFIANKIVGSKDASTISNLLKTTKDSTMINSVPASMFSSLNIDISTIPATNLPTSYLKKYGRDLLQTKSLSEFADLNQLSKILPGFTKSDLANVTDNQKASTVVNMVQASIDYKIDLTSSQRAAMLSSLVQSLIVIKKSNDPSTYLTELTEKQVQILYILFIEASDSILSSFSKLPTFKPLVLKALTIPSTQCCDFTRDNRKLFASYAIPVVTSNKVLTYSNLLSLGKCFASVLPLDFFKSMSNSDFLTYYSTIGESFQPDSKEIAEISTKLTNIEKTQSSPENFVFSNLNDLALYYSSYKTLKAATFKTNGVDLIKKIRSKRDPKNSEIQLCRLGLSDSSEITTMINSIKSSFVNAYISTLSGNRRKRSTSTLSCKDLNNMAGSLNSLTTSNLDVSNTVFSECQSVLGSSQNEWSSDQLTVLVKIAKSVYSSGIETISDANIVSLTSILLGFTSVELAKLQFTTMSSINALGSIKGWTSDQLTNGLGKSIKKYITDNGNVLTSDMIGSMANLACGLDNATIDTLTESDFTLSVSALSKISSTCPNSDLWYAKAKANSNYGQSLYTSTSSLSELGSIIAGISTADLSKVSADSVSSLSGNIWNIMPAATVNSLSQAQLQGLSSSQVSGIINSPNYASFSSNIKTYAAAASNPTQAPVTVDNTDNSGVHLKYRVFTVVSMVMICLLI